MGMNFGQALEIMKSGGKVRRKTFDSCDYLMIVRGLYVAVCGPRHDQAVKNGAGIWKPRADTDLLAEDWEEYKVPKPKIEESIIHFDEVMVDGGCSCTLPCICVTAAEQLADAILQTLQQGKMIKIKVRFPNCNETLFEISSLAINILHDKPVRKQDPTQMYPI